VNSTIGQPQREKISTLESDGFVIQNLLVRMVRVKNNIVEVISVYPEGATVREM
jgi:hypothetical protein